MLIHTLTAAECRDVLSRAKYGRLACSRSDQPYVVPISLYLDPDHDVLFSFSTVGQKIRWMRQNPLVCVEVEEIVSRTQWTTVLAFGRYQEIPRVPESEPIRRRPPICSRGMSSGGCRAPLRCRRGRRTSCL
jgi:nitroimidazol reductase NimA-like FMN-containing flavoprotein (pyridoxamine 5'-phosphate oxidase superfamily)